MQRLFLLFLLLLSQSVSAQTNLYVDSSRASSGAGTSWATAYKTLNEALNFANAASTTISYNVYVAKGTYYPTGAQSSTNRDSSFAMMRNGLRVYGGYPSGGGPRNIASNITVLSGDIGTPSDSTDNSYHVVLMTSIFPTGDSSLLDGFTVAYGRADGTGSHPYNRIYVNRNAGGGMYIYNADSPSTVRNCTFYANSTSNEGGAVCMTSYMGVTRTSLADNVFRKNRASTGGAIYGYSYVSTAASIVHWSCQRSVFEDNTATVSGGAIELNGPVMHFENCSFVRNKVFSTASYYDGGAIRTVMGFSTNRCTFTQNTAAYGGAISSGGGGRTDSTTFTSNHATTTNGGAIHHDVIYSWSYRFYSNLTCSTTVFEKNTAQLGYGGAVYSDLPSHNYTRCSFRNDSAKRGGALYSMGNLNVTESSLTGNYASGQGGAIAVYSTGKMELYRDTLSSNHADTAGGALLVNNFYGSASYINNSVLRGNSAGQTGGAAAFIINKTPISNSIFSGNTAGQKGGALALQSSDPDLTNITLSGDSSIQGNGIYCNGSSPVIKNSILWDGVFNTLFTANGSVPTITYTLIQGGFTGTGNISANPAFVSPQPATAAPTTAGNYSLTACSPAMNAGQNTGSYTGVTDVAGNPRLTGSAVDMGAYEFQSQAITGTLSGAASVCTGTSTPFTSTLAGGVWSSANPARTTVSTSGMVTGISAGTDTIRYTVISNGCAVVAQKTITVLPRPAAPTITVYSGTGLCPGAGYNASASPAGGIWAVNDTNITSILYTSGNTGFFRAKAPGTTSVYYTITGSNGCRAIDTVSIVVNPLPTLAPTTGGNSVCVGATLQLSNATAGGVWSGAANTGNFSISNSGVVTAIAAGNGYVYYTVTSAAGCTSRDTLALTIKPAALIPAIAGPATVCVGKPFTYTNTATGGTWSVGNSGASITPAGIYTATATGSNLIRYVVNDPVTGCPGKAEKSVVGAGPVTKAVPATFCGPSNANYNFGGQIITAAGVYTRTFQTYYGCDSVVTLTYTDMRPDSGVTQSGSTLTAVATNALYKWFRCNPDGTFTATAASLRSFTPTANGSYRVEITSGPCTVSSACFPVMVSGVSSIATEDWHLYPNPTTGTSTLRTGGVHAKRILVQDVSGKTLLEIQPTGTETMLDLKGFAPGLYLVTVADGEGQTATLRLTVAGR